MIGLAYLTTLLASLGCMVLMDYRWQLFFWANARRAAAVLLAGFAYFLVWDIAALQMRLYERGRSAGMTGIEVAPEMPLEELFFLLFLPYLTMVVFALAARMVRTEGGQR